MELINLDERRAEQRGSGEALVPRELLAHVIEQIDAGEISPDTAVLIMSEEEGDTRKVSFVSSDEDVSLVVYLLEKIKAAVL